VHRFSAKPSPAMAVALVALIVALSGSAIALPGKNKVDKNDIKRNAVGAKQIKAGAVGGSEAKNNALTGTDIDEETLGKVPSAGAADTAGSAANATNASALGGQPASAYAPAAVEPVRDVGAPGQPAFGETWAAVNPQTEQAPGFYKDRGRVYLRGAISGDSGQNSTMFTLPEGYRPALAEFFITYGFGSTPAYVVVEADGEVTYYAGDDDYIGLGNISFRAG
jgi:hypothetical protein